MIEQMFEILAAAVVEQVALRPVVDVVERVEVAHSDLDRAREHID